MKLKIKEYLAENMKDLITSCNFISYVLRWLIFCSLAIMIVIIIVAICITENLEQVPTWVDLWLTILIRIPGFILIYSTKIFLVAIPIIWLIQCWDCIKHKRNNKYVIGNLCLWLLLAPISWYCYDSNRREAECMEWCVDEDKSNYDECLFSTCDFPI